MKKIFAFVLGLYSASAFAADDSGILSLFEGTPAAKKAETASVVSDTKEEKSIFSFLNFKKDILSSASEQKLTLLEENIKQAEAGNVNAQLMLGYAYLYGTDGAQIDYDKSFTYYAQAAMQNDPVGLNNLGSLYYSGIGIGRDTSKAAVLFEKAAKLGNPEGAVNLGFILISGNGAPQNRELAMEYFDQAAQAGNPTAKFMLGYAFYTGKLRPQDYNQAAHLIRDAASAGIDVAQYVISQMYMKGLGTPQNYGNAVKNLKLAVAQGSVEAMVVLGGILAKGEVYAKDAYTAHVMFNLASVRGATGAAAMRAELESKMKIDEVLQAQAEAERFSPKPTEITKYINQPFGTNIRQYIDEAR